MTRDEALRLAQRKTEQRGWSFVKNPEVGRALMASATGTVVAMSHDPACVSFRLHYADGSEELVPGSVLDAALIQRRPMPAPKVRATREGVQRRDGAILKTRSA